MKPFIFILFYHLTLLRQQRVKVQKSKSVATNYISNALRQRRTLIISLDVVTWEIRAGIFLFIRRVEKFKMVNETSIQLQLGLFILALFYYIDMGYLTDMGLCQSIIILISF